MKASPVWDKQPFNYLIIRSLSRGKNTKHPLPTSVQCSVYIDDLTAVVCYFVELVACVFIVKLYFSDRELGGRILECKLN